MLSAQSLDATWLMMVVTLPLIGAVLCFLLPQRAKLVGLAIALAINASVLALGWQVATSGVQRYEIGGWGAPLGINLWVDGLSLLMLLIASLVGLGISVYSQGYFKSDKAVHFWPIWMLLWAALNALFVSADLFNLYITLELMGLSAVALVALAGGVNALGAAMRYLLVSLLGSLLYLLGVALIYHSNGSVDLAIVATGIEAAPITWTALGLISAGLLLKTALFPMHFWLPPAHASAPAPVSALLSALVVKGSFYILLRLWLEIFPLPDAALGQFLGLLGCAAVIWGGVQALRQTRLKMLIAYSTVAQLGYLFIAFPLASNLAWKGALYLLFSHALAKSAMFLAAGNIMRLNGHDRIPDLGGVAQRLPLTLAAFALAGISIIGLPPSGGFVGKWLLLDTALRSGQWWWASILIAGSLLAAAYVFKVVSLGFSQTGVRRKKGECPATMEWSAFALALAAVLLSLVAPWLLLLMDIGLPFEMRLNSGVSE